jgi:hypothetical protein
MKGFHVANGAVVLLSMSQAEAEALLRLVLRGVEWPINPIAAETYHALHDDAKIEEVVIVGKETMFWEGKE